MRKLCLFALFPFAVGLVSGCGDPAPSTPLAPDKPMPDAKEMSAADVAASKAQDHETGRK